MDRVVLVELGDILDLAHHDHHGGCAAKQAILGAKVIFPRGHKRVYALLEELAVDFDIRHCDW